MKGGPDRHDGYKDERLLYKQSEVALDKGILTNLSIKKNFKMH